MGDDLVDSPVFASVDGLDEVRFPGPAAEGARASPGEALISLTEAADREDPDDLRRVASEIARQTELSYHSRRALLEQVGLALIGQNEHAEAVAVLKPLAEGDTTLDWRRLQEPYAHALIRSNAEQGAEQRLDDAQALIDRLMGRYGTSGLALGLMGSAFKKRAEAALDAGQRPNPGDVARTIDAYRRGFEADPTDHYPGIKLVALLRLRGQHWPGLLRTSRRRGGSCPSSSLPSTGFTEPKPTSAPCSQMPSWLCMSTCSTGTPRSPFEEVERRYAAASLAADPRQRASAFRQLTLFTAAGDDDSNIAPLQAALTP